MSPFWRRLKHSPLFIAAAVVFLTSGAIVGGTYASFTAETQQNTSTFAGGWIGGATSLAAPTPSGFDSSLSWTAGTHGPVTGQQLYYQDNGTSSSCPTSGYTLASNSLTSSSTSATASNPYSTTLTDKVGTTTLATTLTGTTLNGALTAVATSVPVTSSANIVAGNEIQVDTGGNIEDMHVVSKAGNTLTVTRGQDGTTAVSHLTGVSVNVASVVLTSATTFPSSNGYTFQIGTEDMTVISGAGSATEVVTRGALSSTIANHTSAAALNQISVPVANATHFPQAGTFTILVGSEQMTVTSGNGTGAQTFIVSRAANGTTAAAHASGANVFQTTDPTADGHYFCYQIVSTSASGWTATSNFAASQIGMVMSGLAINTSVTANSQVSTGDVVTATFNQAYATLGTVSAAAQCEKWTATGALTIYLNNVAYTAGTCSAASPAYLIEITGLNNGAVSASTSISAKATVTLPSSTTITWTFTAGIATNLTGTAIGTPASTILSSATTDQAPACTNVTSPATCTPTFTGHGF